MPSHLPCATCEGSGVHRDALCHDCQGSGCDPDCRGCEAES